VEEEEEEEEEEEGEEEEEEGEGEEEREANEGGEDGERGRRRRRRRRPGHLELLQAATLCPATAGAAEYGDCNGGSLTYDPNLSTDLKDGFSPEDDIDDDVRAATRLVIRVEGFWDFVSSLHMSLHMSRVLITHRAPNTRGTTAIIKRTTTP